MKQLIVIILVLATFKGFCTPDTISRKCDCIPGTHLGFCPPEGFEIATDFTGFQNKANGSSIMIFELPFSYFENRKAYTAENLATQGIKLIKTDTFSIGKLNAVLLKGIQKAHNQQYTKTILITGADSLTILCNASSPADDSLTAEIIEKSMYNAGFYTSKCASEKEPGFRLHIDSDFLKLAGNINQSLIYTADGKLPPQVVDKTTIIAASSFSRFTITDYKAFALKRLEQMPLKVDKIIDSGELSVDALPSYFIIAEVIDSKRNVAEKIYQLIVFDKDKYYLVLGSTTVDEKQKFNRLKESILTFTRD
jgi:hypothetical protein